MTTRRDMVALDDAQTLMGLAADLREPGVGRDRLETKFIDSLSRLIGADFGLIELLGPRGPGPFRDTVRANAAGALLLDVLPAYHGYQAAYAEHPHLADPALVALGARVNGSMLTLTRAQLVDDRAWYGCDHVQIFRRAARADHCIYSELPLARGDSGLRLTMSRAWGVSRPFSERERTLVALAHDELARLYRAPEPDPAPPPAGGPRALSALRPRPSRIEVSARVREVLDRLLVGDSEKQVAYRLGLSRHTVHEHVKKLYAACGVHSRAELLAACLGGSVRVHVTDPRAAE
ncbi:MAG: helix-turn-helix transcriptional regulator [Phycisphaerae bacterium]|nr:helix-turn-helix transcriptional regulator [Phycisphaerae bacterium]